MPDPNLPYAVPRAVAALIAGVSPRTLRLHAINTGAVDTDAHNRVLLASLERYLGRQITAREYLLAERQRDIARNYQRTYRESLRS